MIDATPMKEPERAEVEEEHEFHVQENKITNYPTGERAYLELSNFKCELASNKLTAEVLANLILQMKDVCFNGSTKKEVNYTG